MQNLTPKQIVAQLDAYIIGQDPAKRAVAIAIRNRWRRQQLDADMAREVNPKNIVMIGPTGVGKTEIARRLAKLTGAPFVKVEASKFTEVGYHGRDVESMIRDLLDQAMQMAREQQAEAVRQRATEAANDRLVDLMMPAPDPADFYVSDASHEHDDAPTENDVVAAPAEQHDHEAKRRRARQRLREQIVAGKLDEKEVELTLTEKPQTKMMFASMGLDQMDPDMANMFEKLIPEQTATRKLSVREARRVLTEQETEKLIDRDKIVTEAIERTENTGIIFLDEIDKIATPPDGAAGGRGPDVSRQGVQRDLLPIVEGSVVNTRHGPVNTDHILFIAAGAFHSAAVSDLMPELQGRFPIRVELSSLGKDDFIRILTEPGNALTRQQEALLAVEGLKIRFDDSAIEAMAELAAKANATLENIGARRLMTIVEKVFDQINFDAPEMVTKGETKLTITADFVRNQVAEIVADEDLSKFVL